MNRWLSLGLVLLLGFLLGGLGFSLLNKVPTPVKPVAWSSAAQWITSQKPSYVFYARRTFYLTEPVQGAWLRLSADNDFILYVNGQSIMHELSVLNNSSGLAQELSDPFQRINDSLPYLAVTGPHSLVANARDWKLTTYVDLTHYLRPGKNVIALEIQKGQKKPRVVVEGKVYSALAVPIELTTGVTTWRVSTLAETHQQIRWFEPDFLDQSWSEAKSIGSIQEETYSRISSNIFERLLEGNWISGSESNRGEVWLKGSWRVSQMQSKRAFIRFAGDGNYALLINGSLVNFYRAGHANQLHMLEVTNILHSGVNSLAVRLARPLDRNSSVGQDDPLGFFLDGWVENVQSEIIDTITTNSNWFSFTEPIHGWSENVGQGEPVVILNSLYPQSFKRAFEGNIYLLNYPIYLLNTSLWRVGGIGLSLFLSWGLGRFWWNRQNGWWNNLMTGAGLLLPSTLFLVGISLLKHRYAEAEKGLFFYQPQTISIIIWSFLVITALTIFLVQMQDYFKKILYLFIKLYTFLFLTHSHWKQWFSLILILGIGFYLRIYNLDVLAIDSDENTSLDAVKGILRTGVPESSSQIWYTRSPAYHYMLALWLKLIGDSIFNARLLSVFWGTATLFLLFIFTQKITQKNWISLIVTALLALDPWSIMGAKIIRFYPALQFFSLLSFWFFFKGFIEREGRWYQHLFFITITWTILTQEVTVTLLPCFFVGFLFFYRPFHFFSDLSIVISSVITISVFIYDILFFGIKCLTPWVALSYTTDSIIKPHLLDIAKFTNTFFFGMNRAYTIYSLFFFIGLIYFIKCKNSKIVFLFSSILINLAFLTLLVRQVASRYFYPLHPLFIMLAVYSIICLITSLGERFEESLKSLLPFRKIAIVFAAFLLIGNLELDRIIVGYQDAIARCNTEIFEYIRENRQPGDIVLASMPAQAAVSLGGLDYYVPPRTLPFDGIYFRKDQLIDRWGGGVVINNVDQLYHVLENANRVWIHLDGYSSPTNLTTILSEKHPRLYLETLGQPVLESFGVRLRLWRKDDGLMPHVPNQGMDLGNY